MSESIYMNDELKNDMTYKISVQRNFFVYNAHVLINYTFKTSNANKQHQSSIVILMMIQQYLANELWLAMLQ